MFAALLSSDAYFSGAKSWLAMGTVFCGVSGFLRSEELFAVWHTLLEGVTSPVLHILWFVSHV